MSDAKVEVIDESYECNIDDLSHLPEGTIVAKHEQYEYNIDAIRQIQEAKVEIQQDGYNYTIDDLNNYKNEPFYADAYASEVDRSSFIILRIMFKYKLL